LHGALSLQPSTFSVQRSACLDVTRAEEAFISYHPLMRLLLRFLLNALALIVAAWFIPGVRLASPGSAIIAGIVLGFINAIVRPVLVLLTLPFTLLTLGLFIFVVNAICLALTAWLVPGFSISSFGAALGGALIVSLVSWLLSALLVDQRY
jgi:putative membrane protein